MAKAAIIQGLPQMPRDQPVKFLCAESTREMVRNTITPLCVNKLFKIYPFFARHGPVVCLYTYLGNVYGGPQVHTEFQKVTPNSNNSHRIQITHTEFE